MSITYLPDDRRTLLNCHSVSCSAADILSAVGLEAWAAHDDPPQPCEVCGKLSIPDAGGRYIHDFCAGRSTTRPAPRTKAPRLPKLPERIAKETAGESKAIGRRREVARWEHIDTNGEVVACSVRSEQRRKDADGTEFVEKSILPHYSDGKGGWGNKQPGQFVPIWRLPEVLAAVADGEPIWWCEGHKAAQAVIDAGGEASTVLLGELHRDEAEALRGATVRIIPDHDVVGYEKALKAAAALDGIAERVEFWLPATTAAGDDAWDHFAAGFGLDDFVPVDAQRVEVLKILATAGGGKASNHKLPHSLQECRREVEAWLMRAGDDEAEAQTNAQLWAGAAGQHLRSLLQLRGQLLAMPAAQQSDLARMAAVVDDAAVEVGELYAMAKASIDDDLKSVLRADEEEVAGADAEVFALPVRAEAGPRYAIDMPGEWRYDDGADGAWERGVYWCTRSVPWRKIAKLPYVLARIVRRDGRGRRIATDYLIGGTAEDAGHVVNRDELDDGRWAGRLGWALSHDTKVRQAAATAIEALSMAAPEREQVPRINPETGHLDLPAEPGEQYFELAPIGRDEALEVWRSIIAEAGNAPKIAHLLGASAIAPFLSSISDSLPHWISITGAAGRGKTIGLKVGAAIWGNSVSKTASGTLIGPWSASAQAVPQMLGELGIMPAFLDDAGSAGYTKQQWAQLIYRTCAGASRKRTNVRDGRVQIDKSWWSILFTNANDHLTSGIDSGAFQGVIRRVIEIPGPATISAEQAKRLVVESVTRAGLVNRCYGHLGMQIIESVDARQASLYLDEAAKMLPDPEGDAGEVARILQLHLAGAIMIDHLLGTGQTLTLSALESVADTLDEWLPGESEGDRLIAMVRDSLMSDPAAWPTTAEYHDAFLADQGQHGVSERHKLLQTGLSGLRTPDGGVAVLPRVWQQFARSAEINVDQAHRELEAAGILVRNRSAKNRTQTWQTRVRFGHGVDAAATWCYKVMLPELDDDNTPQPGPRPRPMPDVDPEPAHPGAESPAEGAVLGDEPEMFQPVLGDVLGDNTAPTRDVLGVLGVPDKGTHDVQARTHVGAGAAANEESPTDQEAVMAEPTKWLDRAGLEGWARLMDSAGVCLVCGKPCVVAFDGQPIHPPCWKQTTSQERARLSLEGGEAWLSLPKPWPACAVCDEPTSQALNGVPLHVGECVERFRARTQQSASAGAAKPAANTARASASRTGRFAADSAVLSCAGAWLSNGEQVPLPEIRHVGDLVEWAQHVRLGFGGTAQHLPEPGRIWLSVDLCKQLGLPEILETAEDAGTQLSTMREGPFFAAAAAVGWQSVGSVERPWIKVHQGNKSAIITGIGWGAGRYDSILEGEPDPQQLARRLGLLCRTIGFPYTVTPAQTGVGSIEYALKDGLKPVPVPDVPYNHIAANPSWIDGETIDAASHDSFVHVFDRRKSFLAGAGNALLGDGEFVHHAEGCDWDPTTAGFYRVAQLDHQPLDFLTGFDILNPASIPGGASGWISAATMAYLQQLGVDVQILEAVTWPVGGRRLKTWQATIRKAADTLDQLRSQGDVDAEALSRGRAFKGIYTDGFGALARTDSREPLAPARRYRPHWRAEIIGTHTTNTLRAVQRIWSDSGVAPVAIGLTDAIAYIGPSTDPAEAWPGQGSDSLTNPALGKFKPAGYIRLGAWLEAMAENSNARRPVSLIRLALDRGTQW